ncbi:MAG: sulfatase-like hydrolase/transferase [Bryobacteraceae bacterium]|nr:sulfatase-like hydrolase/transferase [Bryobacteraceae bacterium]
MLTRRALLAGAAGQARRRPNLLFFIADDHAGYALGADGNALARTPNLDRLASEGTRFAAHYCNSPVCTPSRQSLLTGQMPHMAGVTRLTTPLALDKPTLARQLQSAGYRTAVFGKMHLNRPAAAGLFGFDTMVTEGELQKRWSARGAGRAVGGDVRVKPPWRPFKDRARVWLNADALPFARYEADMKGTYLAQLAGEFLESHREEPFACWVSFQEPHSPFDFPVEDAGRRRGVEFGVPRVGPEDRGQIPLIFRELSDDDKRGIRAAYYTSVEFLDRNIGRVLGTLARLGLAENTLVVYLADHGYCLGEHGRFEKHCGYDEALRVPLLMRWPGRVRRGVVRDLTEHIDVPATLTDLLGVDPLPVQHGRSLRPYVEGRRVRGRDHVFSEYLENEEAYLRTERYKYVFCTGRRERGDGYVTDRPTPGRYERLYDLRADAGEFTDVARREPTVTAGLRRLLLERFRATHPEAEREPQRLSEAEALEWYLRPRDV